MASSSKPFAGAESGSPGRALEAGKRGSPGRAVQAGIRGKRLNNIAKQDVSKLQRVQNCLAHVVVRSPRFSPSLPLLKQLHWLPVNYIIQFKLSTLIYRTLAIHQLVTHQPPYLASLLHFSNISRQLRSSTSQQLSIPRTKLNLGKRVFSVAAPIIWNELPTTLKSCESLASLRKNLKTDLFKIAFPTLNSRRPLILMMTPICPRLLNLINDFVLLRFRARAPEDLSAIEVILLLLLNQFLSSFHVNLSLFLNYFSCYTQYPFY